jgi:colanic acid/amylovoran/stewartan biosynthesis glycosyltransferase WcaL/AmsK/CpsK
VREETIPTGAGVGGRAPAREDLRVAFVVAIFPLVSETFIIDQIADLDERGIHVDIYSFTRGDEAFVSQRYFDHDMGSRVRYLDYPLSWRRRFVTALPKAARLARRDRRTLLRSLDARRYGRDALGLKLLHWAEPLGGRDYDVVHCHFGTVANDFVWVREVAGITGELITTFYGIDVSKVFVERPPEFYDRLKEACSLYFVMSADMKRRVVAYGFPEDQVRVHPVSVEVDEYPFRVREVGDGEELRLVSVGRFVEKKGFDDLLRALAVVKERAPRPVTCSIVGGGELEPELRALHGELELDGVARFEGYLPVEKLISHLDDKHVLVQPSKTAANGDME